MTVGEMIAALKAFDPSLRIVSDGYEGGYHDCEGASEILLALNVHPEWYYGDHDEAGSWGVSEDAPTEQVIVVR